MKIADSYKRINHKLLRALIFMGLVPTIYTTIRVRFIGQLPSEWSYSIAGQLSWVNLLYEVIQEAIILPLFFFFGSVTEDKKELSNRIRCGLLLSGGSFSLLSVLIIINAEKLLIFMAASPEILSDSAVYIRIESIANVFSIMYRFVLVVLVSLGSSKHVYTVTAFKLVLSVLSDTFLVSSVPGSLKLGINGIAYSNILVSLFLLIMMIGMLYREGINIFGQDKPDFTWLKGLFKIGGISGLESLVRNAAYMLMIVKMVNMVGEQGTYWVANNFIWGWLLLPVIQLGELIKQEVSKNRNAVKENTAGYFAVTTVICIIWIAAIPLYKPFMSNILGYADVDKLYELIMILLGFYVLYAYQNVFDSTFYGLGKTNYMLFESIITNTVYYGAAFILYITGVWKPTLKGIAVLFGIGNAFDSMVSLIAYIVLTRKINSD